MATNGRADVIVYHATQNSRVESDSDTSTDFKLRIRCNAKIRDAFLKVINPSERAKEAIILHALEVSVLYNILELD